LPASAREYLAKGAQKGDRNKRLFAAANQFRDCRFSLEEAFAQLVPRALADGLSEFESRKTVRKAYDYPPRQPAWGTASQTQGQNANATPSSGSNSSSSNTAASRGSAKAANSVRAQATGAHPTPIKDGFRTLLENCFAPGEYVSNASKCFVPCLKPTYGLFIKLR
jgi:hypothetical protein